MLKISMSLAQSPDEDYAPSSVEPSSEASIERPDEELPCIDECETLELPVSDPSIDSNNTSTSPQNAPSVENPSVENRFVREDPW